MATQRLRGCCDLHKDGLIWLMSYKTIFLLSAANWFEFILALALALSLSLSLSHILYWVYVESMKLDLFYKIKMRK